MPRKPSPARAAARAPPRFTATRGVRAWGVRVASPVAFAPPPGAPAPRFGGAGFWWAPPPAPAGPPWNVPLFSAVSRAADSVASCADASFDFAAGVGEAAARKVLGAALLPAADAATTPTTAMAAPTTEAISNVRPLLISLLVGREPQGRLGIGCEFMALAAGALPLSPAGRGSGSGA